jgi:hypothetical protein
MKTVFVNIRMTQEMRAAIKQLADLEHRSVSAQINFMLTAMLKPVKESKQ